MTRRTKILTTSWTIFSTNIMKVPKPGNKNTFTKDLLGSLGMGKPVKPASTKGKKNPFRKSK
jgi:hypothetical protein